jgi:hypothetical protein
MTRKVRVTTKFDQRDQHRTTHASADDEAGRTQRAIHENVGTNWVHYHRRDYRSTLSTSPVRASTSTSM